MTRKHSKARDVNVCRAHRYAFSVLELLVVVAILAMLIAILLPVLSGARESARRVKCLSNMRQITAAYLQYVHENDERFPPVDLSNAQVGFANSVDASLVIPWVYHYVPVPEVFHCPDDVRDAGLSYSVNDYLGGQWPSYPHHASRLAEIRNGSQVFVLIEEVDLHPKTTGTNSGFVVEPYPSPVWIDYPASPHERGTCLTFLDGHADWWRWSQPQTLTLSRHFVSTPGSPDLARLQGAEGLGLGPLPE